MNKSVDFVNVSLRIKPSLKETSCLQVINNEPPALFVIDKAQIYHFDNIFTAEMKQKDVYNETVKPLVEKVKNGYNCTVFAYGQTGTGKTYTMGTNPDIRFGEDTGLISRTLKDFFSLTNEDEEIEIFISFIEIYNEKVFDLLSSNKVPLSVKGFTVCGFEKVRVYETRTALLLLTSGGRNRHIGETKQNFNSSRSHAVFTIYCRLKNSEKETAAKLNLVDLAGSESVRKTGNQGNSLNEGININKGLLSLGQVMTALSNNFTHIPYRQSLITTILHDSLNKKNYVSLIACVSPDSEDLGETLHTLEFSQRVKKMKNKPEINHFISQYKKDNSSFTNYIPRGSTPIKRKNDQMYETPFKKPRSYLPVIEEPTDTIINLESDSPKSLSSTSISSLSDNVQQNLSPVIKKYLNAMEHSLINKLEDVIKSNLRRSTRRSSYNKENTTTATHTPNISWSKVSKIVRSELLQLTGQVSRATSSPVEYDLLKKNNAYIEADKEQCLKPKLLFSDDNYNTSSIYEKTENSNVKDEDIFKIPAPVQKIKKTKINQSPTKRRSSVRLQIKLQEEDSTNRRRSVRLQMKSAATKDENKEADVQLTSKNKRINRKSVINETVITLNPSKKLQDKSKNNNPFAVRTKQVLNILNNGDVRQIATLHTVGPKTAEKIELFRQLKGSFKSISELSNMPYWTKNKYQKFLAENFLEEDC